MIFRHQYRARWRGDICHVEQRLWPLWWREIGVAASLTGAQMVARDAALGPRFTPINPYPAEDGDELDQPITQPTPLEVFVIIFAGLLVVALAIFALMR